jgi:hypothetical protein
MRACRQCGAEIRWQKQNGRWFCLNQDGTDHWDACSKKRWQQVKATGTRFEKKDGTGYANSIHGTKFDMKTSGFKRGRDFKVSGLCKSCVPAWEVCGGCPDTLGAH